MPDSQVISGTRFVGNSPEDFLEFGRMLCVAKLQQLGRIVDAEINRLIEDLKSDVHTCTSHPPILIAAEETVDLTEQDKAVLRNRPDNAATQGQDGEPGQ
ncbi:hypothetical protein SBDP2_320003 [Syntrophobacter sp. SbD2]|nr:hypothetical protein SBDP2_320003 [Syntrophobacter sp. SbD2]